jgi:hypothetical protein
MPNRNDWLTFLQKQKWSAGSASGRRAIEPFPNNSTELFTGDSLAEAHAKIIMNWDR